MEEPPFKKIYSRKVDDIWNTLHSASGLQQILAATAEGRRKLNNEDCFVAFEIVCFSRTETAWRLIPSNDGSIEGCGFSSKNWIAVDEPILACRKVMGCTSTLSTSKVSTGSGAALYASFSQLSSASGSSTSDSSRKETNSCAVQGS